MFMNSVTGPSPQLVGPALLPYRAPLPTPQRDTAEYSLLTAMDRKETHLPRAISALLQHAPTWMQLPGGHHGSSQYSSTQKPFPDGHMPMGGSLSKTPGDASKQEIFSARNCQFHLQLEKSTCLNSTSS